MYIGPKDCIFGPFWEWCCTLQSLKYELPSMVEGHGQVGWGWAYLIFGWRQCLSRKYILNQKIDGDKFARWWENLKFCQKFASGEMLHKSCIFGAKKDEQLLQISLLIQGLTLCRSCGMGQCDNGRTWYEETTKAASVSWTNLFFRSAKKVHLYFENKSQHCIFVKLIRAW